MGDYNYKGNRFDRNHKDFRRNNIEKQNTENQDITSIKNKVEDEVEKVNKMEDTENQDITSIEDTDETKILDEMNYLNIDKKQEENLVDGGKIFKHGSVINCNTLNFREKPNKEAIILHTFSAGENIIYTETNSPDWFEVKDKDGKIGYCMSEYIKVEV